MHLTIRTASYLSCGLLLAACHREPPADPDAGPDAAAPDAMPVEPSGYYDSTYPGTLDLAAGLQYSHYQPCGCGCVESPNLCSMDIAIAMDAGVFMVSGTVSERAAAGGAVDHTLPPKEMTGEQVDQLVALIEAIPKPQEFYYESCESWDTSEDDLFIGDIEVEATLECHKPTDQPPGTAVPYFNAIYAVETWLRDFGAELAGFEN